MKRKFTLLVVAVIVFFSSSSFAQDGGSFDAGVDLYSNYVWRGTKFGSGPAAQPWLEYSVGGFAIGAWGSYGFTDNESPEADLYASYGFDLGESSSLTFTVTDYYFPGDLYFEGTSHYFEPMVSLGLGDFSLTGAYMMNDGEGDLYLEAGLSVGGVDIALGAGDGAYTVDGEFTVCNISVGTSKEIKLTDSFSLPLSGAIVLNPSSEQFNIVVGISL